MLCHCEVCTTVYFSLSSLATLLLIRSSVRLLDRRISDLALQLELGEDLTSVTTPETEKQRLTSHNLDTVDCGGGGGGGCNLCKNGTSSPLCHL